MAALPVPAAVTNLWSRRWVRRLTYVLASGAALTALAGFLITRPAVDVWLVGRLDTFLKDETGLAFQAERLEVQPFRGRFIFHRLSLGGDLFQAERVEVEVEVGSLLRLPHIRDFLLVAPRLRVDQERLARIRLKAHPESKDPTKILLDRLEIRNGHAWVAEPAWGLPPGEFDFRIQGKGTRPNQVRLDVEVPTLAVGEGRDRLQGELRLKASITDLKAELEKGRLKLGSNAVTFQGSYTYKARALQTQGEGNLDLGELERLASPGHAQTAFGTVAFTGQTSGPVNRLLWKGTLHGRDLHAKSLPLKPGTLELAASGGPGQLRLEQILWESQDGKLAGQGEWTPKGGTRVEVTAENIVLAPVAGYTRTGFLKDLRARFQGKASLPGAPWATPRLDQLTFQGTGELHQQGERVGGMALTVAASRVQMTDLALVLPEIKLHGKASARLAKHGLDSLEADGEVDTNAFDVAGVLQVWDIGSRDAHGKVEPFDMEGHAHSTAQVRWNGKEGLQLRGHTDILQPRWHGARADKVSADVAIDRDVLRVTDLQLEKDAGRGYGDLRITWAELPPGAEGIDMCYRVFRLPIHEGLKAADQGDLPIQGTGSGWVRLHGPLNHIFMEGRAVAEAAEAYGFQLPATAADFSMDLATMRLKTQDVRVADTLEHLAIQGEAPTGPLALRGSMDMDIPRERWVVKLDGQVDSQVLGLPGPHLQAKVAGRLDGPIVTPFGPYPLPTGSFSWVQGRLSQGEQSLEGLEGKLDLHEGLLTLQAGLEGMPQRVLRLEAQEAGPERLAASLQLNVSPDSADTAKLATRLTQDFLKDAKLEYQAKGTWGPEGLAFQGTLEHFTGQFDGFKLVQPHPGQVNGTTAGMEVNLDLEGRPEAPARANGIPTVTPAVTSLGIKGQVPFSGTGPLALKLAGFAEMANLKTIVDHLVQPGQYSLLADTHPGGTARVDLNVGGTLQEATLDGTLTVKDGRVAVRTYPQSIENVDFTARFHGRDILITEADPLRGNLAQGAVKAWGKLTWNLGGLSNYDLHANVEDFQFRDIPEGFELQGSLDATLIGNDEDGGILQGNLWAKRMLYRADINLSDLILANAFGSASGLSNLDPSDPLARIELKLRLHLGEPWELDTNLLKVQGRPRGQFWVRGTLAQPGLQGIMDIIPGGRFTNLIPAGDIVLERGSVDFKDPTTFNPTLDLRARVDVPPYLVNLAIVGTLDQFQATPTSTPSLRQTDILAILIDPSSASTVGSSTGLSSQAVVSTGLASTGTGLLSSLALANLQEGMRKTLNLDRVSVVIRSGAAAAATQVIIGKSVNIGGYRIPLVFEHLKSGDETTLSGKVEWRFGDFVVQVGVSQTSGGTQNTNSSLNPSGEIRHTWTPK